MLPEQPTIVVCQTEAEVVAAASFEHDALVVTTPHAACECVVRGIDHFGLEDFYDVTAFLEADEPMLQLQREWADRIDTFVWDALPELREVGLRPAGHYVFFLKILIDTLYRASFELAHLLLAAPGGRIVHFDAPLTGRVPDTLFFPRQVHSALLPRAAAAYGITLDTRPALREVRARRLEDVLPPRAVAVLRALKHSRGRALLGAGDGEVACGRGYDVDAVVAQLVADGIRVTPLVELLPRRRHAQLRDLWPQLRAQDFVREQFSWAGLDAFPLAESRLEYWWTTVVSAMWSALARTRERFEQTRPRAALLYSPWTPEDHGALQGARALGIPTATYQHGGFEGNCEYTTYDLTDLRLADRRLVYGAGTAAYFSERAARAPERLADVVAVGSTRLDALRARPPRRAAVGDGRPLVLYLPTSYQHRCWYLFKGAYLGVPYFRLLGQVLDVCACFPNVQVVYKPFPETPLDPVARLVKRGHPNVSVVHDASATELLAACDAVVIDIPSTALLEALLRPTPVLTHADRRFIRLLPEAGDLLRRRAVVTERPEDFLHELEAFLAGPFEPIAEPDDAFLRAYGTHLDDGRSAERAVRALLDGGR